MSNEVKNNAPNNNQSRQDFIRSLADGSLFTKEVLLKNIVFLLYLLFLGIVFIANRYNAENLVRETIVMKKDIEELKAEQLSVTSALMQISQQSEVEKLIQEQQLDLQNSDEPPKKIILPKELCQR
jgi:hypothetical protein